MTLFIRTIVFVLSLLTVSTTVQAETLLVGISTGYPPYYYKDNKVLTGFCIETINAVARKINIEISYKVYPWKRLILSAQKGDVDAIMPLFKTEEREKYLIFKGLEVAHEINHFFTVAGSPIAFNGKLDDFKSYRIGVVDAYSYGEKFDTFDFPKKKITRDDQHLIEMFMHNRFDIGVGNRSVVQYYAGLSGITQSIQFLDPPIISEILYVGFVKQQNKIGLAQKFAKSLQMFRTTAAYQQLMDKYGIIGQN